MAGNGAQELTLPDDDLTKALVPHFDLYEAAKSNEYFLCSVCDAIYDSRQQLEVHLNKHAAVSSQTRATLHANETTTRPVKRRRVHNTISATERGHAECDKEATIPNQNPETARQRQYYHEFRNCLDDIVARYERGTECGTIAYHLTTSATQQKGGKRERRTRVRVRVTTGDVWHDLNQMRQTIDNELHRNSSELITKMERRFVSPVVLSKQASIAAKRQQYMSKLRRSMDKEKAEKAESATKESGKDVAFDENDYQRFLDANSAIIGRLQGIQSHKTMYGVTEEEIRLSNRFAHNVAAILEHADMPKGVV